MNRKTNTDTAPTAAEVEAELLENATSAHAWAEVLQEIPELWRPAVTWQQRAREHGAAFVEAFLETAKALAKIRESLSNSGYRADLYDNPAMCWQKGCKTFLGMSRQTAERWIGAGNAMEWLVGIRDGTVTEIPLILLESHTPPLDYEPEQGKIRVDQEIRAKAVARLQSVIDGDCTPYRLWPAFCGGLIGGGDGRPSENPTGRTVTPAVRQLELAIDEIEQIAKRAPKLASAWEALDTPRRIAARQTVCDFLDGLPSDLRAAAAKHLSGQG